MKKIMLIGILMILLISGCKKYPVVEYDDDSAWKDMVQKYGLYDSCRWLINIETNYPYYAGCIEVEVDQENKLCKCVKEGWK